MIGLCVDSSSQLPESLAQRFGISVVPIVVTVDGVDHLEGVDLDVDDFYSRWIDGRVPIVTTSQPSPGHFVDAYARLAEGGADSILSVHVSAAMSGTVNAARLAAASSPVPVEVVDSGTASFGVSCCVWAAAVAIEQGASLAEAAAVAVERTNALGSSFVIGVPLLAERSGRAVDASAVAKRSDGVPVFAMSGSEVSVLETVTDIDDAVGAMASYALGWTATSERGLRVAIGTSDESSRAIAVALDQAVADSGLLAEPPVHYRIGPSVGAHTGPGTAGLFVF